MRRPAHFKATALSPFDDKTVTVPLYACFEHEARLREHKHLAPGTAVAATRPDERDSATVYCSFCED